MPLKRDRQTGPASDGWNHRSWGEEAMTRKIKKNCFIQCQWEQSCRSAHPLTETSVGVVDYAEFPKWAKTFALRRWHWGFLDISHRNQVSFWSFPSSSFNCVLWFFLALRFFFHFNLGDSSRNLALRGWTACSWWFVWMGHSLLQEDSSNREVERLDQTPAKVNFVCSALDSTGTN